MGTSPSIRRSPGARSRRALPLAAAAAIATLLAAPHRAAGDGTIDTTGATLMSGASTTEGVTVDPCAPPATPPVLPPVGSVPAQGTFSVPLPDLPSTGNGSDGAFTASTDMLGLSGGEYRYTTYDISGGATVSYSGAVTIRVQGDVNIEGRLETAAAGASVTIIAGGSIVVPATNGAPVTGVLTTGQDAAVRLEAAQRLEVGATLSSSAAVLPPPHQSEVRALLGSTVLRAHGTSGGGVELRDAQVGQGRSLTIGAATFVSVVGCDVHAGNADMLVQSFGGDLLIDASTLETVAGIGTFESGGGMDVRGGSGVRVIGGDLGVHAFGGDVLLDGGSDVTANDGVVIGVASAGDGELLVSASSSVSLAGASHIRSSGRGGLGITAHGGDVAMESEGSFDSSVLSADRSGPIAVRASNDVFIGGFSSIDSNGRLVEIRAGRDFQQLGETFVFCNGPVDARAVRAIVAAPSGAVTSAPNPYFEGEDILLVAGPGGIDIEVDFLRSLEGSITALAEGDVRISSIGVVDSTADFIVQTTEGSVLIPGLFAETSPYSDFGEILIESFGGSAARIDASGASLTTNDGFESGPGPVSLIVHGGMVATDSFVLPKTAKLRANAKKPEKSTLRVAGFFDTGVAPVSLAGPASIFIGESRFDADLVPKGSKFQLKTDQLLFKIKPTKSGSSRAKFSLLLKGNVAGLIDPEGPLTLRFQTQSADGTGTVILGKGGFKLGRKAGLLVAPSLFPFKLKATHKGPGKDSLTFQAGLATAGGPPTEIGDVTISYGDRLTLTVPAAEFEKKGDNFVAKSPPSAPGIKRLNINFRREKVDLRGSGFDLGPLPDEAGPVTLGVTIGEDSGAVSVRVAPVPKRGQSKY